MHFAPDYSMVSLLYDSLGDYLLLGATLWVVYLALEPTLRSRWPHSIVTWNRLLAGRWRDAQVWAHVLIGATVGAVMGMSIDLLHLRFADRSVATDYWLYTAFGPREWLSGQAGLMELGLTGGAWLFFTIFVLRQVVRKDWLAALIASIIWMLANTRHMFDPQWWLVIPVFVVLFAVLVFVLLRLGLVAAMAAIFFANDTASVLLGSDWSAWYVPNGLATLAVLLGIGVFAFVRSLGDRELLGSVS
jgi:serine/threonine-protein kinase